MLQAYNRRPEDFKRRIIERYDDRSKGNELEHRWLQMMKVEELKGPRYYNMKNFRFGHWSNDETSRLTVGQKIAIKHTGKKRVLSPESARSKSEKISAAKKGKPQSQKTIDAVRKANTGKVHSEETKLLWSRQRKGMKRSAETRERMSRGAKLRWSAMTTPTE
jgi:hypothetical protein